MWMKNQLNHKDHSNSSSYSINGWLIWSIAALFYGYEFVHRVSTSVMVPDLMQAFNVTHSPVGDMTAFYFYAYALVQVPAGVLIDRYGVKLMLTFACLLVALGSFMFNASNSLQFACFSRFIIGAGSAFGFVGCLKIISLWINPRYFPFMVGITNLCGVLGAIAGGQPIAHSLNVLTWREVYLILGFMGMIIAALLWIIVKDKEVNEKDAIHEANNLLKGIGHVVQSPQTWILAFYCMMIVAPITGFAEMWGVEFFRTAYAIPREDAAGFIKYMFIGIGVGGPTLGWLSGYFQNFKVWLMIFSLIILTLLCSIIYLQQQSHMYLKIMLFIYGFASSHMLLCFSIANQVFPNWAKGAAIGFINMMIMGGGAIFQPLIGKLLDIKVDDLGKPIYESLSYTQFSSALSVLPLCIMVAIGLTVFIRTGHK